MDISKLNESEKLDRYKTDFKNILELVEDRQEVIRAICESRIEELNRYEQKYNGGN